MVGCLTENIVLAVCYFILVDVEIGKICQAFGGLIGEPGFLQAQGQGLVVLVDLAGPHFEGVGGNQHHALGDIGQTSAQPQQNPRM